MSSRSVREGRYLQPPEASDSSASDTSAPSDKPPRKRTKRIANVYDAVAGRVTTTRVLTRTSDSESDEPLYSRPAVSADAILAPDEVLFRRASAPVRFAEKDIYPAHEHLPAGGRDVLPDSDLLKAIHAYSSAFYASMARRQVRELRAPSHDRKSVQQPQGRSESGEKGRDSRATTGESSADFHSMDETALLAFGILLEEAGREILGERGDLVFTEGVALPRGGEQGDGDDDPDMRSEASGTSVIVGFKDGEVLRKRRQRRKSRAEISEGGDDMEGESS